MSFTHKRFIVARFFDPSSADKQLSAIFLRSSAFAVGHLAWLRLPLPVPDITDACVLEQWREDHDEADCQEDIDALQIGDLWKGRRWSWRWGWSLWGPWWCRGRPGLGRRPGGARTRSTIARRSDTTARTCGWRNIRDCARSRTGRRGGNSCLSIKQWKDWPDIYN